MVGTVQEPRLYLVAIDAETDTAEYAPNLTRVTDWLDAIRLGASARQSVECIVRLPENVEGDLAFIRVSHPESGLFAGWVVHLSCSDDFNSFVLARIDELKPARLEAIRSIQLFSCVEAFDSCSVLTHADVLEWITCELAGDSTSDRFRWIDISMALKEFF